MELDEFREYCLEKPFSSESEPFGPGALVFKVMGKMFALCAMDEIPITVNLKCDPTKAEELREQHKEITPGYHMSKKHWNTINIQGDLTPAFIRGLIDHSFALVTAGLPKGDRMKLGK